MWRYSLACVRYLYLELSEGWSLSVFIHNCGAANYSFSESRIKGYKYFLAGN